MAGEIRDPEVRLLAAISTTLKGDYVDLEENLWEGSPFAWIRTRPSRQRGKIGEQLVAGWCAAKEFNVLVTGDAEADRVINGKRVEIKFSTLWGMGGYKFQLRNQNYQHVICLGLAPFNAHCWVIPKSVLMDPKRRSGVTGQHAGRAGVDTAWLSVSATSPHDWLSEYGGTLAQAFQVLKRF